MAKAPYNQPTPLTPDQVFDTYNQKRVDNEINRINWQLKNKMNGGYIENKIPKALENIFDELVEIRAKEIASAFRKKSTSKRGPIQRIGNDFVTNVTMRIPFGRGTQSFDTAKLVSSTFHQGQNVSRQQAYNLLQAHGYTAQQCPKIVYNLYKCGMLMRKT